MFVIYLKLTDKRSEAANFMAAHKEWIERGFAEGVFLLLGNLKPQAGGAIVALGDDLQAIEERVKADPFVREGIAIAEIQHVAPTRAHERLSFLLDADGKAAT